MGEHSGPYATANPNKSEEQMDVEAALCFALARRNWSTRDIGKKLGLDAMTVCRRLDRLILLHRPGRSVMRLLEAAKVDDLARAVDQVLYGTGDPEDVGDFTDRAVQAHLTPQDVASLVRTGLAARARTAALWGLDHQSAEAEPDGDTGPTPEPTEWELAGKAHRDSEQAKIDRGEFG